ncbi:SLOG family protein [Alkalicoccobacillus murimartini]|uniref:UPF0398 protein J2S05_000796 n=1 Tax=Alkalicoccobacillus murimartini TaxID=171685 RepID=A0ABT9YFM7_9BACI|nr:DUF1273 domain-containing protein [Alkalicoccobacillus murimartini]MDQ0206022.1 putative phage-like protein YoqJ [Alkalicoccobacillus murimartini]
MKTLLITGYKPHELGIFDTKHPGIQYIKKALSKQLISLIEEGIEWVIISGQQGVELWSAEVVFDLKELYPDVKVAVLLPFLEQEAQWKEASKEQYQHVLNHADFVKAITNRVYDSPAQLRLKNDYLVDKSDALLILYDEDHPGTPKFYLEPALKKQGGQQNYPIYYLTPEDIEDARRDEEMDW